MEKIKIFTDGSVFWKTGQGGAGAFIQYEDGSERELSKGFLQTKIGRMELMALIMALEVLPTDREIDVLVYSDSEYVVKAFTEERLLKWISRDFEGTANPELWQRVVCELMRRDAIAIEVKHIKGHQKITDEITLGNNLADAFADYKAHEEYEKDIPDEIWGKVKSNKK